MAATLASLAFVALSACSSEDPTGPGGGGSGGSGGTGGSAPECPSSVTPAPGTVITDRGAVTGQKAGETWVWRGIPYAAPPVAELRFRPPTEHACWEGALSAIEYGDKCLQLDEDGEAVGSEDCLTLNVWAPAGASSASPAPVLFFVHGGGNVQGSASELTPSGQSTYDGQALAEQQGAMVVTIQYRLQAAGWLSLPALDAESDHASSGNYAMLDQIAALSWVQRNIAAFGGDPSRVLLFGESAGALDTCALVASPLAKGLFSAALMESGACIAASRAATQEFGQTLVEAAGCAGSSDVAACLRALPAEALVKAVPVKIDIAAAATSGFGPSVDGWVLPLAPLDAITQGNHNHVPFIVGVNSEETGRSVPPMDEAAFHQAVLALAGGSATVAATVEAQYPLEDYASPRAAYVAITSDVKFVCGARRAARAAAAGQSEAVYRYYFTHAIDNGSVATKAFGAFHGLELLFVFNHLTEGGYTPSSGEAALALAMGGYWKRFADKGDPSGEGAVSWPLYDAAKDTYLRLDNTIVAGEGIRTAQCDFWDTLLSTM